MTTSRAGGVGRFRCQKALAKGLFATLSAGGTPAVPGFAVPVMALKKAENN
jgi:hypothetical protein